VVFPAFSYILFLFLGSRVVGWLVPPGGDQWWFGDFPAPLISRMQTGMGDGGVPPELKTLIMSIQNAIHRCGG